MFQFQRIKKDYAPRASTMPPQDVGTKPEHPLSGTQPMALAQRYHERASLDKGYSRKESHLLTIGDRATGTEASVHGLPAVTPGE